MSQYIIRQMQFSKNTMMSDHICTIFWGIQTKYKTHLSYPELTYEQHGKSVRCNIIKKQYFPTVHAACNSMCFVRNAAVCSGGNKKKYAIQKAAWISSDVWPDPTCPNPNNQSPDLSQHQPPMTAQHPSSGYNLASSLHFPGRIHIRRQTESHSGGTSRQSDTVVNIELKARNFVCCHLRLGALTQLGPKLQWNGGFTVLQKPNRRIHYILHQRVYSLVE